jgi:hypothetical protein
MRVSADSMDQEDVPVAGSWGTLMQLVWKPSRTRHYAGFRGFDGSGRCSGGRKLEHPNAAGLEAQSHPPLCGFPRIRLTKKMQRWQEVGTPRCSWFGSPVAPATVRVPADSMDQEDVAVAGSWSILIQLIWNPSRTRHYAGFRRFDGSGRCAGGRELGHLDAAGLEAQSRPPLCGFPPIREIRKMKR